MRRGMADKPHAIGFDVASAPLMVGALAQSPPGNLDDFMIAVWVHRMVLARRRLAAATATLAECDADAARAGLCLKTLKRATLRSRQTAADRRLDAAAGDFVRIMETTPRAEVTGCGG